jgi:hypothetical protein
MSNICILSTNSPLFELHKQLFNGKLDIEDIDTIASIVDHFSKKKNNTFLKYAYCSKLIELVYEDSVCKYENNYYNVIYNNYRGALKFYEKISDGIDKIYHAQIDLVNYNLAIHYLIIERNYNKAQHYCIKSLENGFCPAIYIMVKIYHYKNDYINMNKYILLGIYCNCNKTIAFYNTIANKNNGNNGNIKLRSKHITIYQYLFVFNIAILGISNYFNMSNFISFFGIMIINSIIFWFYSKGNNRLDIYTRAINIEINNSNHLNDSPKYIINKLKILGMSYTELLIAANCLKKRNS